MGVRTGALYKLRQPIKRSNTGATILGAMKILVLVEAHHGSLCTAGKEKFIQ